jgi:hypothetical protein
VSAAYRSADLVTERFGPIVARHERSIWVVLRTFLFAAGLLVVGLSALLSLAATVEGESKDGVFFPLFLGAIGCTAAVALVARAFGSRGTHLELRERGLIHRTRRAEIAIL